MRWGLGLPHRVRFQASHRRQGHRKGLLGTGHPFPSLWLSPAGRWN